MSIKIRIKVGHVEVEFEGSEEFFSKELPALLKNVSSVAATTPATEPGDDPDKKRPAPPGTHLQLATNAIAIKLAVKNGSGLLVAAAAHLALVKGLQTFTRQQILKEMRTASSYYKKNYGANFTKYLKTVTEAGTLNESAANCYALSANGRTELEKKIAH